ncbi:MAG: IS110 family transposase [Streptosporangiales bacterium]
MQKAIMGIDISMDDFHVCFKVKTTSGEVKIKGSRSFRNSMKGFEEFLAWSDKKKKEAPLRFVMEATGVYHENLACFLYENEQAVSVVLANKMKNYIKSLNQKTKTDKADAKAIAGFGTERTLVDWEPMSPEYKEIRDFCRELLSQKKDKQRAKSQLHAFKKSHKKSSDIIALKEKQIELTEKNMILLKKEIHKCVNKDKALKKKIKKIETIPGLAFETAVILVCETNGFALFDNIRQIVSYAGLDISFNQSGNHNGKTRISKKGNSRIRQALYMPALTATRCNDPIKELLR